MWLQLPDGSTFNLNAARVLKVGAASAASERWALLAELPSGEDIVLAEFQSPQGAQRAHADVVKALKSGKIVIELT